MSNIVLVPKVPCSHVVKTAKASVESNPEGATAALKRFAAVSENDAETGAHRIFPRMQFDSPHPCAICADQRGCGPGAGIVAGTQIQ